MSLVCWLASRYVPPGLVTNVGGRCVRASPGGPHAGGRHPRTVVLVIALKRPGALAGSAPSPVRVEAGGRRWAERLVSAIPILPG